MFIDLYKLVSYGYFTPHSSEGNELVLLLRFLAISVPKRKFLGVDK